MGTPKRWDPMTTPSLPHFYTSPRNWGWGMGGTQQQEETVATACVKVRIPQVFTSCGNEVSRLLKWKVGRALAGATSPLASLAGRGLLAPSTLPNYRPLTCAWPGLCKQQTHNLQEPGPLQSSKAPSDGEWPATEQERAQLRDGWRVRT